MKKMVLLRRVGLTVLFGVMAVHIGLAQTTSQTTKPKTNSSSAIKPTMAVWTPDVQKTLGVSAENFNAEGPSTNVNEDAKLFCAGCPPRDPTQGNKYSPVPQVGPCPALRKNSRSGNSCRRRPHRSHRDIHQTINRIAKRSGHRRYTGDRRPCPARGHPGADDQQADDRFYRFLSHSNPVQRRRRGKEVRRRVERGTLGTYTDAKGPDLGKDLAGMMDQDLQPLRAAGTKTQ